MSIYEEQFYKYGNVVNKVNEELAGSNNGLGYFVLLNAVRDVMVEKPEDVRANAVVMFGFSGNGKSTYISNFVKANPDYTVVSIDEVVNRLYDELNRQVESSEIITGFGEELERVCTNGSNIIVDGNFLNLLTRSALTDTLKTYGYQVNIVDITDNIGKVLPIRVMDMAGARLGVKINHSNVRDYVTDPVFIRTDNEIWNFYQKEKRTSSFDEQIQYDAVGEGVNNVFKGDTPYEYITHMPQSHR